MLLGLAHNPAEALLEEDVLVVRRYFAHGLPPLGVAVYDAGVDSDAPRILGQAGEEGLLKALALPVGENVFADEGTLLIRHDVRILRPGRKIVHLAVNPHPGELRRKYAAFAEFADCADNQLALENVHSQAVAAVIEGLGGAYTSRLALGALIGLGPYKRALIGYLRLRVNIVLTDLLDTLSDHACHPFFKAECNPALVMRYNALVCALKITHFIFIVNR